MNQLKTLPLCPKCNKDNNPDYLDTLYPANRERTLYNFCCQIHNFGCGRVIHGKTPKEAIQRFANINIANEDNLTNEEIKEKLLKEEKIKNNLLNL